MSVVAVVAGIVVGLTFLVSGGLKLTDRTWPAQASALGVPRLVARALPFVELPLGALLAAGLLQPATGIAAAALLVAFTAVLLRQMARGQHPPCACFGRLTRAPIGPGAIARNVVLVALALLAAFA